MATLHRFGGLRVVVYSNDHRPAHVHVMNGSEAVFVLHCPKGPPELRQNFGFRSGELDVIARELSTRIADLCAGWSRIHGDV